MQDVFAIAYRRLGDFEGGNIAGWLYQIARRKVRDHRRLFWVQCVLSQPTSLLDCTTEPGPGPLDELVTKQRSEVLNRRLALLTAAQREVFTLFELEGLSGQEIAQREQVSLNTVWMRLYNARRKLKARPLAPHAKRRAASREPSAPV